MRRRAFLSALGAALLAPRARAQPAGRPWRIAFMAQIARPEPLERHFFSALTAGLRELGYREGRSFAMDWRFGGGDVGGLPDLARSMLKAAPDVVVTAGVLSALAVQKTGTKLPVVFGNVADPVASGLVKSLARPGTNFTGLSNISVDIIPKLLELLLAASPEVRRVGILTNPMQAIHTRAVAQLEGSAVRAGVRLVHANATSPGEIDTAFKDMVQRGAQGLVLPLEGLFIQQRHQVAGLAVKHALPLVSNDNELAATGGFISYGADQYAMFRRVAVYVDRILKGARPEELPVEQPATFSMTVNLATARTIGVVPPQSLLLRADQVIE